MSNGDESSLRDDPATRASKDLSQLGLPSVAVLSGVLDDAINYASDPVRTDPLARPWVPIGPRNIGGRIRTLAQDPRNPNTLYAGSAIGGVWKTEDAGDSWEPLDLVPRPAGAGNARQGLPIGAIAVAQSNPRIIYVGTGEPTGVAHNVQSADYPQGVGLLRSSDGGATWSIIDHVDTGTMQAQRFERILVDPWDPERCWIATPRGLFRREAGPPIAISQDTVTGTGAAPTQDVTDIAIDFGNRSAAAAPPQFTVYAALRGTGLFRATFNRATKAYVALPDGSFWKPLTDGINEVAPQRIKIALCERHPSILYAIFEKSTPAADAGKASPVYRSEDRGDHWTQQAATGETSNIGWYAFFLVVHPERSEIVFFGMMDVFRSTDSGRNWTKVLDWTRYTADRAQHADQHGFLFDGLDPRKIWIGNDGGISMSRDLGNTWRKRSHGILATQPLDITVHPTWPFVMGSGFQDNGTWVSFGGPSWHYLMQADGGAMGFVPGSLASYYITWQYTTARSNVAYFDPALPAPAAPPLPVASPIAPLPNGPWVSRLPDLTAAAGAMPELRSFVYPLNSNVAPGVSGPFVGVLEAHPSNANEYLVGWTGGLYRTTDGVTFVQQVALAAAEEATAIAYAPTAPNSDWWLGSAAGRVFLTTTGAGGWAPMAIPGLAGYVSDIAVHPQNNNIVAITIAANPGLIFITGDRGTTWREVSGRTAAPNGVPSAGANDPLPPAPFTAVAFDPASPSSVNSPQILYVGTLAGVYVTRVVVAPMPVGTVGHPGDAPPVWLSFNANLPLLRVTDFAAIAVRDGVGVLQQSRLLCATMGRGVYRCELLGAGDVRLLIRDTSFDDGQVYPGAPALGSDPRRPGGPAPTLARAFDIRVDAPPFSFFEETMDGVEFDEDLINDTAIAGERNLVYVQIHQTGTRPGINDAKVNLYYAFSPGAPPPLQANFWDTFPDGDPPAAGPWHRAAPQRMTRHLAPGQPEVIRFEWTPPADAPAQVALLALCTQAADDLKNPVPTLTIDPAVSPNLVTDRRAALRLVSIQPFTAQVFVRDGADDSGDPGALAWGGRSADIIPRESEVASPDDEFKDLADLRTGDTLVGGKKNFMYVRVHNRKNVKLTADVELFRVPYDTLHQPNTWQQIGAKVTVTDIPEKGWKFAPKIEWDGPPPEDPGPSKVHLIVALVSRAGDPKPDTSSITDLGSFWEFFLRGAPANNAALRGLRWRF